jgi:hypothetical protein
MECRARDVGRLAQLSPLYLGAKCPRSSVLINQTDVRRWVPARPPSVAAAAIGNAFFDATGVRLREIPFTPERVKAALQRR